VQAEPITPELRDGILRQVQPELREMFGWHLDGMRFVDGDLLVYRDMAVTPEWIHGAEAGQGIGSYWGWYASDLSPYLDPANCPVRLIMTALVDPDVVNWNHVAGVQRHGLSLIHLEDGTPLRVIRTKVEIAPLPDYDTWSTRFDPIPDDLPNWVGHTFAAGSGTAAPVEASPAP